MSKVTPKAAAPKLAPAVVVPEAVAAPFEAVVHAAAPVVIDRPTLRAALERISDSRLCGCKGDHDPEQYECPKTIARAALELA